VRPKEGVSVWNDEFMKSLYEEVVERRLMPKNDRWRDLMAAGSASPGD
jgi:hypothetical protein